ncbi:hypothetical protein T492DRAFT_1033409 [Pavlovales sp. CCMP2436]|nr:hypothetical protein T492DRAFT_1033409 [Pavlovales sp. CCMP2436]
MEHTWGSGGGLGYQAAGLESGMSAAPSIADQMRLAGIGFALPQPVVRVLEEPPPEQAAPEPAPPLVAQPAPSPPPPTASAPDPAAPPLLAPPPPPPPPESAAELAPAQPQSAQPQSLAAKFGLPEADWPQAQPQPHLQPQLQHGQGQGQPSWPSQLPAFSLQAPSLQAQLAAAMTAAAALLPRAVPVLERVLAADNARKKAADERNAQHVLSLSSGELENAHYYDPTMSQLGASMLQRAHKQQRRGPGPDGGGGGRGGPMPVVPTDVYATGIPKDASQEEVELFFSRVGPISSAVLYYDDLGMPKGDVLVTYRTRGGAEAALKLLNGRHVYGQPRPGAAPVGIALVKPVVAYEPPPRLVPPPPPGPAPAVSERSAMMALMARTIVIKRAFTESDAAAAPSREAMVEGTRDDLWTECCRCGEVEQIGVHFDGAAFGCASVRFEEVLPAAECVDLMDGRYFCERQLEASFWDGDPAFACALDVDRPRQLQFGFGDAAEQAAPPEAGGRAAQGSNGPVDQEELMRQFMEFSAEVGEL